MQQAPQTVSFAKLIGLNARRIRGTSTAEDVAREAKRVGLRWSSGRISELESGRVSPTLPMLFALSQALQIVAESPVSAIDLVETEFYVEITPELVVGPDVIRRFLSGEPVQLKTKDVLGAREKLDKAMRSLTRNIDQLPSRFDDLDTEVLQRTENQSGETEQRIAKSLGISMIRMNAEQALLWADSFSVERDRRAGPDANAQKRGRIARVLKAELKASLAHGND